uniref:SWIM-type domain-containing protein n=1 Tax=Zea mays TaxID=4577 RepID=A0A804MWA0_MAIZE
MVEGWRDSMDRLVLIKLMGYLSIFYDYRKGGNVRPSRPISEKRKTPAGRPNTKRVCVCHFIVKRLIVEPSVALVIYNHNKHVDKKDMPCHGSMDKMAVGTKAMFAPYISDVLRLQVMSVLYVGIPVETIMQRHTGMVEKQGGPSNRDDLLTHRYVRILMERKIRRSVYELDDDDAISIDLWVENNQDCVFFYEDFSDTDTFVLGIQTDWQLQQMIQFGSHTLMASDSKFGTNKLKGSWLLSDPLLLTVKYLPGAWITVLNTTPLASAQVASAIESYHHLLKLRLLNEADESVYWRADWLVDKLGTKVHSYYWLDEFSGKNSFSRYWRSEWSSGPNPWSQGTQIPDSDVVIEGNHASVVSQTTKEKSHAVLDPCSEFALCDCGWSMEGNLCKHVLKSAKIAVLHAVNGSSSITPAFQDPQPTSRPREAGIEEADSENGVCASQSQPGAGDDEDHDVATGKRRKSGNAPTGKRRCFRISGQSGSQEMQVRRRKLPGTMERPPRKRAVGLVKVGGQEKLLLTMKRFV